MTKILYTSLFVLAIGCGSPKTDVILESEPVDTIILKNQNSIIEVKHVDSTSNKVIETKVTQAVEKIETLTNEIVKVKKENAKMKFALKNPPVLRITDTVYIEKKRNFWGREKTSVSSKSDSTTHQSTDSTTVEVPVNDSTQNN